MLAATPNRVSSGQRRGCSILFTCAVRMSRVYFFFYTIVTDVNGPFTADLAGSDVATHIQGPNYGACTTLILILIMPPTRLYHRGSMCSSHESFQSNSILSCQL